jgi:tRNA-dihydrouridine synthase
MQGITDALFRAAYVRHFGGLDRAVAPFVSTVHAARVKPSLLADLLPAANAGLPVVPQVLGKDPGDLAVMLRALMELGYRAADLNAGCPWPMVARKGRGAGLLADPDRLRRMLDAGCGLLPGTFSIKVRLGLATPDLLLQRMDILNAYPLREVTIHPRTARQMYAGSVDLAAFAACLAVCRHPVAYSGDLRTVADGACLAARFPSVARWVLGRGLLADPWLPARLRGDRAPRDPARLRALLDDLLAGACGRGHGDRPVLGRLKEYWAYLGPSFAGGDRLLRRIRLCQRVEEYRRVVDEQFVQRPEWVEAADGLQE